MKKIILAEDIISILGEVKISEQKIIIVGGCFDILHLGHVKFLQKAKTLGGVLIILLESDQKIKMMKGNNRPINSQKDRAEILASLENVDYVVLLPKDMQNSKYDEIVQQINPDYIATTKGDPHIEFKKRTARLVGAKVKCVSHFMKGYSTGKIINKCK